MIYDADTGVFTWIKKTSRKVVVGRVAGSPHRGGYITIGIDGRLYLAHRLAMLSVTGEFPIFDVDHINGNRSDNKYANLRIASRKENLQNIHGPMKTNTSNVLGAHKITGCDRWAAKISVDGVQRYLGCFKTPQEAGVVYMAAKRNLHPFNTL
jgi:hypothetical protein